MSITNQADFYLNFQKFSDLKLKARGDSDEAARAVARQFEGLFVQQMLSAMRAAAEIDSGEHSSYMDFYREMYDKQLAQTIAGQDRLGVAKLIMQQLPGAAATSAAPSAAHNGAALGPIPARAAAAAMPSAAPEPAAATPPAAPEPGARTIAAAAPAESGSAGVRVNRVVDDDFAELAQIEQANRRWREPHNFVADLLPEAQRAARQLGVSAELLLAQAALETGWGKHTMKFDDGRSSNNLFGIKAGPEWRGGALSRPSLEYSDGVLANKISRFRAYASPADSLDDYVEFIQSSPRYRKALASAHDDAAYIREIQRAGYATDPNYADKVIGILRGDLLQASLARIDSGEQYHA